MAIGGSSKSRKLPAHNRLQKRLSVRRVLLESLEPRQMLAVGPQLIGIQPNNGELLQDGEVLHSSPPSSSSASMMERGSIRVLWAEFG